MQRLKKLLLGMTAVSSLVFFNPTLYAQDGEGYLKQIADNTYGTLQKINDFVNSWLQKDDTSATSQMQTYFGTLGNLILKQLDLDSELNLQLAADLFNQPINNFKATANGAPTVLQTIPNVNDLVYSSILGKPLIPSAAKNANPAYNYLKNASAMTIQHVVPGLTWQGDIEAQNRYQSYYNTIMSIESFNAYALSGPYTEGQGGNSFTVTQAQLIKQASDSKWLAEVAQQELGKVFRQILMFSSQSYVLLSQIVQMQKQLLTATVMTNSLLILANQTGENLLVSKAQGVRPQP